VLGVNAVWVGDPELGTGKTQRRRNTRGQLRNKALYQNSAEKKRKKTINCKLAREEDQGIQANGFEWGETRQAQNRRVCCRCGSLAFVKKRIGGLANLAGNDGRRKAWA